MDWTEGNLCIKKYDAFVRKITIPIRDILYEGSLAETPPIGYLSLRPDKVHELREHFESEGCRRKDYPVFARLFDGKYVCLDRKHRLEADKLFFRPADQLWIIIPKYVQILHLNKKSLKFQ